MKKAKTSPVRYVNGYEEAPKSAEYILRASEASLLLYLEHYEGDYSYKLKEFNSLALYHKDEFYNVLLECRQIIGPTKVLWVEKPAWMREDYSNCF